MDQNSYQVIYKGEILPGYERPAVLSNAARILSVREDIADKILNGKRVVLKKNLDEAEARRQCLLLKRAGLRVALGVPQTHNVVSTPPTAPPSTLSAKQSTPSPSPAKDQDDEAVTDKLYPAETEPAVKAAVSPASTRIPLEFNGSGSEYFRIWIVNILLSIATLGIYSAWAKVRRKQYFYGNTRLNGASFEYLADPFKILKGRLIVGGVLLIAGTVSAFFPVINFLTAVIMAVLSPWLITRSLMFNARNSAWRNIRFEFKGRYREASTAYVWWPFLAMLTFGLLSPYAYFRQKKFLVENSAFGKTAFRFTATVKEYYHIAIIASLLGILTVALAAVTAMVFMPLVLLTLPIYLGVYSYFAVKTGNLLFNSARLGRHRLQSTMEVKGFMWLVLTNTLATALTLGLFYPWAKVRTMNYKAQHLSLIAAGDLNTFVAEKQKEVGAIGDASSDFFDFDLGL